MTKLIEATPRVGKRAKTTEELIKELARTPGKAEIVNGKIVRFVATGEDHGTAAFNIALSLKLYQRQTNIGKAFADNVGFIVDLPNRKSFSPDAAYFIGEKSRMKFCTARRFSPSKFAAKTITANAPNRKSKTNGLIILPPELKLCGTLICRAKTLSNLFTATRRTNREFFGAAKLPMLNRRCPNGR